MTAKQIKSFRLSDTAIRNLGRLSARWKLSQADVISILAKTAFEDDFEDFANLDEVVDKLREARRI